MESRLQLVGRSMRRERANPKRGKAGMLTRRREAAKELRIEALGLRALRGFACAHPL